MNTTDKQSEMLPVVNEKDEVIGKISRGEWHKKPDLTIRGVAILVFDEKGRLLIQKRSLTKDSFPGWWTFSVGGHVDYGDDYLPSAIREAREELGVKIASDELKFFDKILVISPLEKVIIQVYKYLATENAFFNSSKDEVSEIKFVDIDTLKAMLKNERWTPASHQILKTLI